MKFKLFITLTSIYAIILLTPARLQAFEDTLSLGAETGYSFLYLRQPANTLATSGSKSQINLFWGISDCIGVNASVSMAWYFDYAPVITVETIDEEGVATTHLKYGAPVTRIMINDFALSLVYAFDIMRVVPFVSIGILSARVAETRNKNKTADNELGMRLTFGADYTVKKNLTLGAVIERNTHTSKISNYKSQTAILLRATYVWNL